MPSDVSESVEGPVVVPIDFTGASCDALAWGARYARARDLDLLVLHVVHDRADAPGYYRAAQFEGGAEGAMIRISEAAEKMLRKFIDRFRKRSPGLLSSADTRLVVGVPATRILEVAEDVDASVVVMGSRGRTGLARILLGSTAEHVVRMATMPVVIVKDDAKSKAESAKKRKKRKKRKDKKSKKTKNGKAS